MKASFQKCILNFKQPAGTSRGILNSKEMYIIELSEAGKAGVGECNFFKGLSPEKEETYESKLNEICQKLNIEENIEWENLREFPSIQFGLEQAQISLNSDEVNILFPSEFTKGEKGIRINGLIWMGSPAFMKQQIQEKLNQGFTCLKLKIGTFWNEELNILKEIRKHFSAKDLELRVDANGAFTTSEAKQVLQQLSDLKIHSIEQPIKQGNWQQMAELCATTPTPIALDEELIGIFSLDEKLKLLQTIQPQYIILKPALIGGFAGAEEWIQLAKNLKIDWWITSALESNIGLNALAQWTFLQQSQLPQGLGTGGLFTNNFVRLSQLECRIFL